VLLTTQRVENPMRQQVAQLWREGVDFRLQILDKTLPGPRVLDDCYGRDETNRGR
jgi:hypothetical protein